MEQIIGGIIVTLSGFAVIIFRKKIADSIVKLNNEEGLGFYKYGKKQIKVILLLLPLFGLLFIVIGTLILFGIFELQQP